MKMYFSMRGHVIQESLINNYVESSIPMFKIYYDEDDTSYSIIRQFKKSDIEGDVYSFYVSYLPLSDTKRNL